MLTTYVRALLQELHRTPDTALVLEKTRAAMTARGHEKLYSRVLRAAIRELEAAPAAVTVRVAEVDGYQKHAAQISEALRTLNATLDDHPEVVVDATLIGGYAVAHKHQIIDATYKKALITLYHRITKS
jgi:F0F1-type ATP synthase delta subunit